ncbi:MAG TPA: hypothetical protein VMT00_08900 [Thermoanaerobaculia bacterium]|nr:hypothetical protein [Thermoanaerobaculia bacterium]
MGTGAQVAEDSDLRPGDGRCGEPWVRARKWPKILIFGLVADDAVNHGYGREGAPKIGIFGHMA